MKKLGLVFAVMAVAIFTSNAFAQYQLDDDTSEVQIGLTNGGQFAWGNMFAVDAGKPSIDTLEVGFGVIPVGTAFTWYVFNDDDGNPTAGLTLLASGGSAVVNNSHIDTSIEDVISIGTVDLTGGDFVFLAVDMDTVGGDFPAAQDSTSTAGASWVTFGDGSADNWAGGSLIDGFGLPGNWIIRGTTSVIPEPTTAGLLAVGLVGLMARRRR